MDYTEPSTQTINMSLCSDGQHKQQISPFEGLLRATGTSPEVQYIPRNYELGKEYRSRPQLNLDWIITTDPSNPRAAKEAPEVAKPKGVPVSEWIFDTKEASEEYEEHVKPRPAPPVTLTSRPKMELEWILSTRPSQETLTRVVEPVGRMRNVPTSEWILGTDPDYYSAARYEQEIYSFEDFKNELAYMDEESLIRTANLLSDRGFAPAADEIDMALRTAKLLSDRGFATPPPDEFDGAVRTARSAA